MNKTISYLLPLLCLCFLTSCSVSANQTAKRVQHEDSFYNVNLDEYPLLHLPFVKPIEAKRVDGRSPWRVLLYNGPYVKLPDRKENIYYVYAIEELDKFAINDGVILAYSAYIDKDADPYILDHYYHWFVVIPGKQISEGFQTEDEFTAYIKTLGITDPQWQKPDDAYALFEKTGCLEGIPDCK